MQEKKCITCKVGKYFCKGRCKKCYENFRYAELKKYFELHPEEYEADKARRKGLFRKRSGMEYDKTIDLTLKIARAGQGTITWQGYKRLPGKGHPNSQKSSGCILEHVLVMSNYLGRPLNKGETVHHKNGDRLDNRIENLELRASNHGPGQNILDILKWCKDFINQYEHELHKLKELL